MWASSQEELDEWATVFNRFASGLPRSTSFVINSAANYFTTTLYRVMKRKLKEEKEELQEECKELIPTEMSDEINGWL